LGSDACLSIGARWLEQCLHEHPECRARQRLQAILPKHLLDVGDSIIHPHLYLSSENEIGNWVALSYVWGGNSDFKLTETSMSDLQKGLPLSTFPLTLRDAILVTRALGLQYLWIDALYILQDNVKDWEMEASLMGGIYKNAILMIAVTSANSVTSGFLDKREANWNCTLSWHIPGLRNTGKLPIVVRHFRRAGDSVPGSCWASRGWTFQEHLLSQRILLYTSGELQLQCYKQAAVENNAEEESRSHYQGLFKAFKDMIPEPTRRMVNITQIAQLASTKDTYNVWYELCENYSSRHFTFIKDCLPAIAGFARKFQGVLKDDFCAGLWKKDLLRGLVWVNYALCYSDEDLMEVTSRNRWPSWSWLSSFSIASYWPLGNLRYTSTHFAKVIDVEIDYATEDKFGDIGGGKLLLEAPSQLFELVLEDDVHPPWSLKKLAHITLTKPKIETAITSRSVVIPITRAVHQFAFVKVMEIQETRLTQVLLLLQRLNTGDAAQVIYRRVALVCTMPLESYDEFIVIATRNLIIISTVVPIVTRAMTLKIILLETMILTPIRLIMPALILIAAMILIPIRPMMLPIILKVAVILIQIVIIFQTLQ
jgi:hypothetical protein